MRQSENIKKSFSISSKIWLSLSIMVLGYFVIVMFAFSNGKQMESRLQSVSQSLFPASNLSQTAQTTFENQVKLYTNAILLGDPEVVVQAGEKSAEALNALQAIKEIKDLPTASNEAATNILKDLKEFTEEAQIAYAAMSSEMEGEDAELNNIDLVSKITELAKRKEVLKSKLAKLTVESAESLKNEISQISQSSERQRFFNLYVAFFVIVIGLALVSYIIRKNIVNPIIKSAEHAIRMSKGDFSQKLDINHRDEIGVLAKSLDVLTHNLTNKVGLADAIASGVLTEEIELLSDRDSLGKALRKMKDSLAEMIAEITNTSKFVAVSSNQVSNSSQALSQGATEQASSLEEISSSMVEMEKQTMTNTENANLANDLSDQTSNSAEKGNQQMKNMVAAMGEINAASKNISKIIKVIDEIAFQTNLLALNAAVEAARAGKHGKGFAVVAEEVRNLAARSAKAAGETAQLIEGSVATMKQGEKIAEQTAEALEEIVTGIAESSNLVKQITAASTEQATGISHVSSALSQVEQVTQSNTANAEESAAAAHELSNQALNLQEMLGRFKLNGIKEFNPITDSPKQHQIAESFDMGHLAANKLTQEMHNQQLGNRIVLDDHEFGKY